MVLLYCHRVLDDCTRRLEKTTGGQLDGVTEYWYDVTLAAGCHLLQVAHDWTQTCFMPVLVSDKHDESYLSSYHSMDGCPFTPYHPTQVGTTMPIDD
jgi:hypothetical protein